MMFKTVLFGGLLFATICVMAQANKPKMASLEVYPNYDQSLTYKDFRVHYSGVGADFSSTSDPVFIRIYKKGDGDKLAELQVDATEVDTPKAYYFGDNKATDGEYEVDVCVGSDGTKCSGKNPALTKLESKTTGWVTCFKVKEEGEGTGKTIKESTKITLDVKGPSSWITSADIDGLKKIGINTEWVKYDIQSNPSYEKRGKGLVLYAGILYDLAYYRELFLSKGAIGGTSDTRKEYTHEYCERKYLLSSHIHLLQDKVVKYRFKKTLHLSEGGKQHFVIKNDGPEGTRSKIHVEMAFPGVTIAEGEYDVWVSICSTEKDEIDSTVCSDPFVHQYKMKVSGSE